MSLAKKIVAGLTALATITMASPVFGVTAEELLAQIQQLQQQLNQLMAQYQQLTGQQPTGVPAACTGITFDRDLKLGMSGNDVKCLQALLNQDPATKVAESGAGSPGAETTYFGPLTKAAVIKFQEKYASEILTPVGLTAGTGYVGAKTRAKLNSMLTAGGVVTPPPAYGPMTVSVAADTPPAANLQKGTPNNPVLKLVLSGSQTETVNVSGITLKQYGNIPDAKVTAVRLWDENGVQLGNDRTVIGGMASFVIVPTLSIAAGGSRTITVTVDIASDADTLTTVQLGVDAATAITGAAFTGNFPVKGNVFTVVPAGQYGSLSVGGYGTLPKYSVKIGEKDVVLNRFIVSAGAREDVRLTQVTIENAGNCVDTDITNIRIREVGGSVVAGPVNLSAKKATFNITGVTITKGTSKKFEVVADIVTGNQRQIDLVVKATKVIGVGVTSGISIVASGTDADFNPVTIGYGSLVVSQSANHPVGTAAYFVKSTTAQKLGVFSVKAVGEDILINQVSLSFSNLSNSDYLTSVGLYDGESLVSDLKDSIKVTTPQTFTLNWIVPANTTKELTVKGVTYNVTSTPSVSVAVTWNQVANGYGLASGESITASGPVSLSAVTIYPSGTISIAALDDTKTPLTQGVLSPLSNVLLGALKLRVTREDMKLYELILKSDVAGNTSTAVAEVALFDTEGNQLSNYASVSSTTGTFTIGTEDLLQEVVFPKDTYKTILVKGRVSGTADAYRLLITSNALDLIGVDSSAVYQYSGSVELGTTTQGSFYLSNLVLEMKKNADSPSDDIDRSSAMVSAIWDITNPTGTNAPITAITFYSKTGLPSGATASMFKLYDELGYQILNTTTTVSTSSGTVTFQGASAWTVNAGMTRQLKLVVDTTNTGAWPSGTYLHWTVNQYNSVVITGPGYVGYAGTVWSLPADANSVKIK